MGKKINDRNHWNTFIKHYKEKEAGNFFRAAMLSILGGIFAGVMLFWMQDNTITKNWPYVLGFMIFILICDMSYFYIYSYKDKK
jgi:hypothetical protein